jgi:hypothetical protein
MPPGGCNTGLVEQARCQAYPLPGDRRHGLLVDRVVYCFDQ